MVQVGDGRVEPAPLGGSTMIRGYRPLIEAGLACGHPFQERVDGSGLCRCEPITGGTVDLTDVECDGQIAARRQQQSRSLVLGVDPRCRMRTKWSWGWVSTSRVWCAKWATRWRSSLLRA